MVTPECLKVTIQGPSRLLIDPALTFHLPLQPTQLTHVPVKYNVWSRLNDFAVMFNVNECNVVDDNDNRANNSMKSTEK